MAEPMIRPKDDPSEGCDWLSQNFCLMVRLKDAPKPFDWLIRSNSLIGPSDRLVLLSTLLIGRSADQLLASSLGFLATQCQTCKYADEKTITRKRLLWVTNTPF